jgi:hypothetical protein
MGCSLKIALTLTLSRKRERGQCMFSSLPPVEQRVFFFPLPLAGEGRVRARPNHRFVVRP